MLSPQQVMGKEPSRLDDIYSLGATIFDLLTGTPPFYKGEVFAQICAMKAPSMTARIQELEIQDEPISPVWEDTVARCLAKNPADRPQSVLEVSGLLQRDAVDKPGELPTASKPTAAVEIKSPEVSAAEALVPEAVTPEKIEPVPEVIVPPAILAVAPPATPAAAATIVTPSSRSNLPLIVIGFGLLALMICVAGAHCGRQRKRHDKELAQHPANGTNSPVVLAPGTPGSVDAQFKIGTGTDGDVREMLIQPDGKILAAGRFLHYFRWHGSSEHRTRVESGRQHG